jgi:hypothetical protein
MSYAQGMQGRHSRLHLPTDKLVAVGRATKVQSALPKRMQVGHFLTCTARLSTDERLLALIKSGYCVSHTFCELRKRR